MVSVLLLMVCFLALIPLSTANTTTRTWSSRDLSSTYAHTWQSTRTWTWSRTWSNTWSRTWSNTWHTSWSRTWSQTWSKRTQIYPTYTSTEYVPYPPAILGCDPSDPYCNGYYSPGYVPPQTPNPWCYPNNPYCNVYPPVETATVSPLPSQTVVTTQLTSQAVMFTQTVGPDFSLSADPSTVSLPPNDFIGSTNFVLTVTSVGGWSGQVQFTTSPLPQGITLSNLPPATYQLNSPIAGWNVQVTIDASAITGSYLIVITGLSGSFISSVAVTIGVSNLNGA